MYLPPIDIPDMFSLTFPSMSNKPNMFGFFCPTS